MKNIARIILKYLVSRKKISDVLAVDVNAKSIVNFNVNSFRLRSLSYGNVNSFRLRSLSYGNVNSFRLRSLSYGNVNSFRLRSLSCGNVAKNSITCFASQMKVYFGCGCLLLKIPDKNTDILNLNLLECRQWFKMSRNCGP